MGSLMQFTKIPCAGECRANDESYYATAETKRLSLVLMPRTQAKSARASVVGLPVGLKRQMLFP